MARLAEATGTTATYLQREDPAVERDPIAYPMVNISVAEAAECLGKSQQFVRVGLQRGILPFGNAVSTKGRNMTYYINPERFREYVTPGRFDAFFGVKPEHTAKR